MTKKHICDRCEENIAEENPIISSLQGYQHLCRTCIHDESYLKCTSCPSYVDWLSIKDSAYLHYIIGHNRLEQDFICPKCCEQYNPKYPERYLYSLGAEGIEIYFDYEPCTIHELIDIESNPKKYEVEDY